MPRKYKKCPGTRRYASYSIENLNKALEDVRSGKLSLRGASEKYSVDKMKIHRCLKGKNQKKYGGQMALSVEEETFLTDKLITASEWGFPMTSYEVRQIVKTYLERQGRKVGIFKENLPGEDWMQGYLNRNGQRLTVRMAENIKRCRAAVSPQIMNEYFDNLEISLLNVKPGSIINYDETNLADDPGKKRVVVKRGCKHPEFVLNSSKASTSVMMACAGNGTLLPPFVIYRSTHLWDTWINGGPKGTRYGNTKSGWIDQKTFDEWFSTIALPYLKRQDPPRALIGDNLSSHLSAHVIAECKNNDIRFIFLPKNSTHIAQPLDVAYFRPFKRQWRDILMEWKLKGNRGTVPKNIFPSMLKKLLSKMEANTAEIIKAGFKKSGIIPIDRMKVLDQIPKDTTDAEADQHNMENSLVDILRQLRYNNDEPKKNPQKKKNLRVQPGKSVVNIDSDSDSSPENNNFDVTETLNENDDSTEDVDNSNLLEDESDELPIFSEFENFQTESHTDWSNFEVNYNDIREEDFLLIEMQVSSVKKQVKRFVAQVFSVAGSSNGANKSVEVSFLRPYKLSKDTFTWPDVKDTSFVYSFEVKYRLPMPQKQRRGLFKFPFDVL